MFDSEEKGIIKILGIFIGCLFIAGILSTLAYRSCRTVDFAFINYEEFQDVYNTAKAINDKLCNLNSIKDDDPMFKDFSKSSQLTANRNNLIRWINEYNSKSKQWHRSMWKSNSLPYELSTSNFSCYQQ